MNWWNDVRHSLRTFLKNPGFTVSAITALALGIGANTAIFSVVNALLLKSLPYPQPDRMGTIFRSMGGSRPDDGPHGIDGAQWIQLRDNVPALISAVSRSTPGVNLQAGDRIAYVRDGRVSQHYFDVLGIHLAAGHNFTAAEDQPHGPNATILS